MPELAAGYRAAPTYTPTGTQQLPDSAWHGLGNAPRSPGQLHICQKAFPHDLVGKQSLRPLTSYRRLSECPHSLSLGPFSSYTPVSLLLPSTCHAALNIQEYEQLLPSGQGHPKHPHTGTLAEAKGAAFQNGTRTEPFV